MENKKFVSSITNAASKACLKLKKHSPEILVVTGIVGIIAGTVVACRATTKAKDILDESKERINLIRNEARENTEENTHPDYHAEIPSKNDVKRDCVKTYVRTGIKLAACYAPAAAIGTASIACILASHGILNKRNAAMAAAYATVEKGFSEYRKRVIERFGEETERELKYGIKAKQIEEVVKDPETGKEKKNKRTVNIAAGNLGNSPYAMIFDEDCQAWERDHDYNMMYLRAEQQYANDRLRARGYLYLNEVLERLGVPGTKMGQIVGWVYDPGNAEYDNFVDFGVRELNLETAKGTEEKIVLDFNVHGNILDLMP